MDILEIKDLTFSYGNEAVLKNVNLKLKKGEKLVILGANGSGKSTLFLIMNGVLKPDSGQIILDNSPVKLNKKGLRLLREHIGIVFQEAESQIIASTVFNEISFGLTNLGLSVDEVIKRTEETLDKLNIQNLRERAPHFLSGGEQKKVTIADIIAMKPEIVIFDEPTTSLDPIGVNNLKKILEDLSNESKTLVISTHLVNFAWEWADRIAVLNDGFIQKVGTPEQIFSDDELLYSAHLEKPILFELEDFLITKGLIKRGSYSRTVSELEEKLNLTLK